jgi:hypothetical protein
MFRHLRTRLFAAALLVPLIAFATATGGHWLRCRITGAIVSDCCCDAQGGDAAATSAPTSSTVSEADCCDHVARSVSPTVAELRGEADHAPIADATVSALEGSSIEIVGAPPAVRAVARSSLAPPTARQRLVAKRTLLI